MRDDEDVLASLGLPIDSCRADKNALDDELERHAHRVWVVSDAIADARYDVSELKATLTRIEGRVRGEHSAISGDKKRTVKDVDAMVARDPEVRRSEGELFDAERKLDKLNGLLSALQTKTSALKHLSELYQAGYYVTTSTRLGKRERGAYRPQYQEDH